MLVLRLLRGPLILDRHMKQEVHTSAIFYIQSVWYLKTTVWSVVFLHRQCYTNIWTILYYFTAFHTVSILFGFAASLTGDDAPPTDLSVEETEAYVGYNED